MDVIMAESRFDTRAIETKSSPPFDLMIGKSDMFSFLGWCGMLGGSLSSKSIHSDLESPNRTLILVEKYLL